MPDVLTVNDIMMCPHGGSVNLVSNQVRVQADNGLILRPSDTFVIAGCPFCIGPVYHPCVSVKWVTSSLRSSVGGNPSLTSSSVGLCLAADQVPQGTVMIQKTQMRVESQ